MLFRYKHVWCQSSWQLRCEAAGLAVIIAEKSLVLFALSSPHHKSAHLRTKMCTAQQQRV